MPIKYLTVEHLNTKDLTRIFSKIEIHPDVSFNGTPCWLKQGFLAKGYGRTKVGSIRTTLHRLFFAWLVHPIPIGQKNGEIDHLCRRRHCCNPVHLEFVSSYENFIRGNAPSAINARKIYCYHRRLQRENKVKYNEAKRLQYAARLEHYRAKQMERYYKRNGRASNGEAQKPSTLEPIH